MDTSLGSRPDRRAQGSARPKDPRTGARGRRATAAGRIAGAGPGRGRCAGRCRTPRAAGSRDAALLLEEAAGPASRAAARGVGGTEVKLRARWGRGPTGEGPGAGTGPGARASTLEGADAGAGRKGAGLLQ